MLPSDELAAALAHEEAHLRRQDPAARLWLAVASLVTWPHVASFFQRRFHQATEQACDAEAATAVGNPSLVAMALVNSAGLLKHADEPSTLVAAFGESPLEHRVHLLLQESTPRVAPARALFVSLLPAAVSLGIGLSQSEHVHHAVETLLHHFF